MKKVGNCYYFHKSDMDTLRKFVRTKTTSGERVFYDAFFMQYQSGIPFDIVKINKRPKEIGYKTWVDPGVSFIQAIGWDELYEPIVGDSYNYRYDMIKHEVELFKIVKGNNKVYHHKWMFVDEENYKGFDIEDSKQRSKQYESIEEIMNNKSRIGNLDYWASIMKKYNLKERMI